MRLREGFARRGIAVGTAGLAFVISAHGVQAAPATLAVAISTAALAGTAGSASTALAATKIIAMTTLQKTLIGIAFAAAVGSGVYQARQASTLRTRVQSLQQQLAPLDGQLAQLRAQNRDLSNRVARANDSQALSAAQMKELLTLRGRAGVNQADERELARLKSTLAQQSNQMPDYLTNAMAMGMGAAEKIRMKQEQDRLARMNTFLHLTDDQQQAIDAIQAKHIKAQTQMTMDLVTGKFGLEQQQALDRDKEEQEAEIKALLTPDQLAAYPDFTHAERVAAAEKAAQSDADRVAGDFNLSREQANQVRASFYEMNMKESDNPKQQLIDQARKSGRLTDMLDLNLELQKAKLDEKSKILESFLTPEQLQSYRRDQSAYIDACFVATRLLAATEFLKTG